MVGIGIVLLVIGAILLLAPLAGAPLANLSALGWLLAVAGVILIVVGLLIDNSDVHAAIATGGLAVAVVPRRDLGGDDPAIPVAGGNADREPVLTAFIVGAVPLIIAAVSALADLFAAVPDWIVPTFTVLGTLTTGLAALWARVRVTPTALPRLDDQTPLVPMVEREAV